MEVIQPHVPVRLPCYDLAPLTDLWFELLVANLTRGPFNWLDGRCVQGAGTYSARDFTVASASLSCYKANTELSVKPKLFLQRSYSAFGRVNHLALAAMMTLAY